MNYWLLCLPRADIERCMNVGTFGLKRKYILGRVAKGDRVVCCSGKGEWKVIGLGNVTSGYYLDDRKLFLSEGFFPDRFDFECAVLPKEREVELFELLERLSFVKDLAHWSVFFRNGIVQISKDDFELVSHKVDHTE